MLFTDRGKPRGPGLTLATLEASTLLPMPIPSLRLHLPPPWPGTWQPSGSPLEPGSNPLLTAQPSQRQPILSSQPSRVQPHHVGVEGGSSSTHPGLTMSVWGGGFHHSWFYPARSTQDDSRDCPREISAHPSPKQLINLLFLSQAVKQEIPVS